MRNADAAAAAAPDAAYATTILIPSEGSLGPNIIVNSDAQIIDTMSIARKLVLCCE